MNEDRIQVINRMRALRWGQQPDIRLVRMMWLLDEGEAITLLKQAALAYDSKESEAVRKRVEESVCP